MPSEAVNLPSRSKCFVIHVVLRRFRGVLLRRACGLFLFMAFWPGLRMGVSAAPGIENDDIEFLFAVADNENRVIQENSVNLGSHPTQITLRFLPRTNNLSAAM